MTTFWEPTVSHHQIGIQLTHLPVLYLGPVWGPTLVLQSDGLQSGGLLFGTTRFGFSSPTYPNFTATYRLGAYSLAPPILDAADPLTYSLVWAYILGSVLQSGGP